MATGCTLKKKQKKKNKKKKLVSFCMTDCGYLSPTRKFSAEFETLRPVSNVVVLPC